jgi:soluble lytic murein transglycosylase-like protein
MDTANTEQSNFLKLFWGTTTFSLLFIAACVVIFVFLPNNTSSKQTLLAQPVAQKTDDADAETTDNLFIDTELTAQVSRFQKKSDDGLLLYRQTQSRAAVEWFYTHVTNNRDIAIAVLEEAEKNNIPLSLAFALAHTESMYKVTAMHRNTNDSIDRGLFQLNDKSFPDLTESDFYNPKISAKYGLSHLRFCLNSAGNEIAALAMYNAGTNKVRSNSTPQQTLNYISQIESYRGWLEDNFSSEVLAFYEVENDEKLLAKK